MTSLAWPSSTQRGKKTSCRLFRSLVFDPETGDVGNCMTSKYFAVGPFASFTRAGVGSITIMQSGPFPMGEEMLDWMEKENMTPLDVVRRVRDTLPDTGQINIVDTEGRSISATGAKRKAVARPALRQELRDVPATFSPARPWSMRSQEFSRPPSARGSLLPSVY